MTTRRFLNSFIAIALFFSMFVFAIYPASAAEGVNLDQWNRIAIDWQNGNLGKDIYTEGRAVPFRLAMENFSQNTTYQVTISHEVTKGGNVGYDFLAKYDQTEPVSLAQLCNSSGGGRSTLCNLAGGLSNAGIVNPGLQSAFSYSALAPTFGTPPHLSGVNVLGAVNQNVGAANAVLTSWGAQSVTVAAPTYTGSTSGDSEAAYLVTFKTPATCTGGVCPILLAWGGHLASSSYWRTNTGGPNGAGAISGSAYHMRTTGFGNQDRSIKTGSDLLTFLEVIKDLNSDQVPGINGRFNLFIQQGALAPVQKATNVGDLGTTGPVIYTISSPTSFTVSEQAYAATDLAWYWKLVKCYDRFGSQTVPIAFTPEYWDRSSLTFGITPGQDIYCIIENKDIPTAVSIVNAKAVAGDDKVTVSWEAPFMDTLGYHVLRDGDVISELFTPSGPNASFTFVDNNVKVGETYTYWIQTVEGDKEMLSPVVIYRYLRLPVILR